MKKLFFILSFFFSLIASAQVTPVPFSSLTTYTGNLDSVKLVGLLKSGNAWTNRVFYGIDLAKARLLLTDTAGMLSPYARAFDYYNKSSSDARYLQSFSESDPVWTVASANYYTKTQSDARYLQSFTESDPSVPANVKAITATNISNWNTAFGWGNHASAGYELASRKATSLASPDNTKYPTTLAVANAIPTNNNQLTNGAGFITGNQSITWTASTDISGSASGTTSISPSLTVVGIRGASVPALSAGLLKYNGAAWVYDNSSYLTANQSISFTPAAGGDVTGSSSGATSLTPTLTIGAGKVTNAMHSTMAAHTYKGNNTASTATPIDVTTTQLTADLNQFTSSLQGLVPASGGGTSNFLRADGTWTTTPSGFSNPMTTKGDIMIEDATPAPARLAGPTSSTKQFLTSTGTGTVANNPSWGTIAVGDVPTLNQNTTGSAGSVSGTNVVTNSNLSQMAANSIKGNNTGSTANALDLTTSQVKTLLAIGESDVTNLTTDLSSKQPVTTVATALTAAGSTQGTALALSGNNSVQEITTAAASTGVKLPTASATSRVTVINRGANSITVYPASSGVINAQSANVGYTLPAGASTVFVGKDATSWYTERQFAGGDASTTDASAALTLNTVNANTGTFNTLTVNGKGLVTAASNTTYHTGTVTSGNVPYATGSSTLATTGSTGANGLFWDNNGNKLGVNVAIPTYNLQVGGNFFASAAVEAGSSMTAATFISQSGVYSQGTGSAPNFLYTNNWNNLGSFEWRGKDGTLSLLKLNGSGTGTVTLPPLAGNGSGIVAVDNSGNLSWLATPGGTGTVTNFSAGDLSPLFTTTEATTTTTPALSFSLSTAAAHTFFGNNTGSTAAPSYSAINEADVTSLTTDLSAKAPLASPTFTGTPSLPTGTTGVTQTAGNNSTALATTAFVQTAITAVTGHLLAVRVFTSGTSYTPTSGTTQIVVQLLGAGGGGGGVTGVASSVGAAGGGGAGAYVLKYLTGITAGPYTIAVGAGGTAGANTGGTGGTGGSTTITVGATTYTAAGGVGGVGQTAGTAAGFILGGAGGAGTNGDVNSSGAPGLFGQRVSGTVGISGKGGDSDYGGGGIMLISAAAGSNGTGFGAGGGGALSTAATARAGGVGSGGLIIIYEYD